MKISFFILDHFRNHFSDTVFTFSFFFFAYLTRELSIDNDDDEGGNEDDTFSYCHKMEKKDRLYGYSGASEKGFITWLAPSISNIVFFVARKIENEKNSVKILTIN